jgi:pantoate--beta-alanine ligase
MSETLLYHSISEISNYLNKHKDSSLALVPTMGALHRGHLSLVKKAKELADLVAVSIFVNPLQFNDKNDLAKYPRELEKDQDLLMREGVDLIFAPSESELYNADFSSYIEVGDLTTILEGVYRPGHFRGVTTVVAKLLNLFIPTYAIFGEKDFQQLRIIEKLVKDLSYKTKIVRGELIREESGLALSSRNARLSEKGRQEAAKIYQTLQEGGKLYHSLTLAGNYDSLELKAFLSKQFIKLEPEVMLEYLELIDESDLKNSTEATRVVLAAYVEGVRLIDTINYVNFPSK